MMLRERHSDTADAADAAPDDGGPASGPGRRAARRGVVGALVGALVMLVTASALAMSGQGTDLLGLSGVERGGSTGPAAGGAGGRGSLTSAPGACLSWNSTDASDVSQVDCATPHVFETAGAITAGQPPGAPFPADDVWQKLVTDRCLAVARTYLGGKLDPAGRYRAGALKPTQTAWDDGDRTVRCGLQAPGRTGALFTSTGKVADHDQAVVFDPGTCLGLDGKDVSDPVDCGARHAAEVAGTVDLGQQFRGDHPSVDDQDNYLQPTCAKVAADHLGGDQKLTDSKLTVYWTNLSEDSWKAGTRRVDCNLGSLLGDGSGFAPLTGSATDGVKVGDASAGATVPPLPAGAPAGRAATGGPATSSPTAPGPSSDSDAGGSAPVPTSSAAPSPILPGVGTDPSVAPSSPSVPLPSLPLPLPGR